MSASSHTPTAPSRLRLGSLMSLMRGRPTWFAQGTSAASSLVLVTLFTRSLSPSDFATYAVVIAVYAFGAALVGTTIGTRAIKHLSADGQRKIIIALHRDVIPVLGCILATLAVTRITSSDPLVMVAAASGMLGILIAQVGGSHLLGLHQYWRYARLVLIQMMLWDAAAFIAVFALPVQDRLAGALFAVAMGGIAPAVYIVFSKVVSVVKRDLTDDKHSPISAVGVASLALWILASGDRVILAHYSLTALATYAAIYGLLDRVFRTFATAEFQQRLPRAFATYAKTKRLAPDQSLLSVCLLIGLGTVCSISGPTVVSVVSGGNYHPDLAMSTVLSFAMMAMLAAIPSYVSLIATGRTRIVAIIAIGAAGVNILGNLLLAPTYGTSSATALTLLGYLIWLVGIIAAEKYYRSSATKTPLP